jgi:hypothetical protein
MLRVASIVANLVGFRLATGNQARLRIAEQALDWASMNGAHLLLFPAGYLWAASPGASVLTATNQLRAKAKALGLAIVVGVDTCPPSVSKSSLDTLTRLARLPFFVVAWAPGMSTPIVWQQRSITSKKWRLAPAHVWAQKRSLRVGSHDVSVAICGEAFTQPMRNAIETSVPRPSLVALPAHAAQGLRHWHALKYFSSHKVPSLRAVHALHSATNALWDRGNAKMPFAAQPFGPVQSFEANASLFHV